MEFLNDIFTKRNAIINNTNKASVAYYMTNAPEQDFEDCKELLKQNGYLKRKEGYFGAFHRFEAYEGNDKSVFINYYKNTEILTIVEEKDCRFFEFSDTFGGVKVKPQITQVHLEDFGMSYAIRLSDGRFIVIDGGRDFKPDADELFRCLKEGSPDEKPIIAAWIFTHAHSDHFHCIMPFYDTYGKDVVIERFMYNFPERDDTAHYPKLTAKDSRFVDSSPYTNIALMEERVAKSGAKVYMPHTGQKYIIGDAVLEILSSIDDTIHLSNDLNPTSLMIRMELGGQVILWSADASYSHGFIPERYGSYLKADILQIPHHGFGMGDAKKEIEGYELIKPETCFLPVSEYNAFNAFCIHKPSAKHIMMHMNIGELITGDETRTIPLPYTPAESAKSILKEKVSDGIKSAGAKCWIFQNLSTAQKSDFEFCLLNTTHSAIKVCMELFFENSANTVRYIYYTVPPLTLKPLNIIGEEVEADSVFFNWMSLKERGIPENAEFAVRFLSDIPIVVTHKNHKESYRS